MKAPIRSRHVRPLRAPPIERLVKDQRLIAFASAAEELLDNRSDFLRPCHEKQMTAIDDVKLRLRNERSQNPGVDDRRDGVIIAGQDESALASVIAPTHTHP